MGLRIDSMGMHLDVYLVANTRRPCYALSPEHKNIPYFKVVLLHIKQYPSSLLPPLPSFPHPLAPSSHHMSSSTLQRARYISSPHRLV